MHWNGNYMWKYQLEDQNNTDRLNQLLGNDNPKKVPKEKWRKLSGAEMDQMAL